MIMMADDVIDNDVNNKCLQMPYTIFRIIK